MPWFNGNIRTGWLVYLFFLVNCKIFSIYFIVIFLKYQDHGGEIETSMNIIRKAPMWIQQLDSWHICEQFASFHCTKNFLPLLLKIFTETIDNLLSLLLLSLSKNHPFLEILIASLPLLQRLIFEKPAQNIRKVVLATNMAEASITINDVVFVIDCGKAKETTYDALNNTPCLLPSWISQASARQVSQVLFPIFCIM